MNTDAAKARLVAEALEELADDLHGLRLAVQLDGDRGGHGNPELEDRLLDLRADADRCVRRVVRLAWELDDDDDDDEG
jgi:hypothetical protein